MDALIQHKEAYKKALQSKDNTALLNEKAQLTTIATAALLEQNKQSMREIRACCADLSALADKFDITGKPGDRWRALGDILTQALESGKPLEQIRLVLPSTLGGLIIKHINSTPGITPTELAKRCDKSTSHISNEIKKLADANLITRFKRGKNHELFLSVIGKETLDSIAPMKSIKPAKVKQNFKYLDQSRLSKKPEVENHLFQQTA